MSVKELSKENFDNEIAEGVAAIDFWAPWCGPCKMIAPLIDELSQEMPDIKFAKVNIDDNQEIAVKYNVMSIPTVIVFKDGKPVSSTVGVASKKALKDKIENA